MDLKTEVLTDPARLGYAGKTAAAIVALGAVADRPATRPVPAKDVRRYLDLVGRWRGIAAAAAGFGSWTDAQREVAVGLRDALSGMYEDFDLQVPVYLAAITAQLDDAVEAGLIAADHKAAILGMENVLISRWQEIGVPTPAGSAIQAILDEAAQ